MKILLKRDHLKYSSEVLFPCCCISLSLHEVLFSSVYAKDDANIAIFETYESKGELIALESR